jgi:hypothetical protein
MLKKFGLSAFALLAVLLFAGATPADAKVRFGFAIGTAPYAYPVDPYTAPYTVDPYSYPYTDPYYGYPAPSYAYPAPAYVEPYYGYGYGFHWGDRDHHEWREHENHEFREHGGREDHGRR